MRDRHWEFENLQGQFSDCGKMKQKSIKLYQINKKRALKDFEI